MSMLMLRRGTPIKVPPTAEAVAFLRQEGREPGVSHSRRMVVGDPATVRSEIEQVVEEYRADEAILVSIAHDHEARKRSYELVAKEFELS
jgi:alkanesulfonate monooxygenase SsuD/methylene tetrahydromethanopterin reductase-like flavin-dependent oxidoreductase (luciferase family)